MTEDNIKRNVTLEIAQAEEVFEEAETLFKAGLFRGSISRTYYALFHYVRALVFTLGLEPRTHQGLTHLFHLHFVKTGSIDNRTARIFSRLQKYREQSDYDSAITFERRDVEEELRAARTFRKAIRKHLKGLGVTS